MTKEYPLHSQRSTYSERAAAGLIISEGTNISSHARGFAFTPGIWNEAQVEAWKPIVEAVHHSRRYFLSAALAYRRISHPSLHGGTLPIAPSAVTPIGHAFSKKVNRITLRRQLWKHQSCQASSRNTAWPRRMQRKQGSTAWRSTPQMLTSLISGCAIQRTCARTSTEVPLRTTSVFLSLPVRATIEGFGDASRVGVRVAPLDILTGKTPLDSNPAETYGHYISELSKLGLSHLHMVEGVGKQSRELEGVPLDFQALRHRFDGVYIANNMYTNETAEAALVAGEFRPCILSPAFSGKSRSG